MAGSPRAPVPRAPASTWEPRARLDGGRRGRGASLWLGFALGLVGLSGAAEAWASSAESIERAQTELREVDAAAPLIKKKAYTVVIHQPEKMVAQAELHLRSGNKLDAISVLNKVTELGRQGRAKESTVADAEFLLGEAYFENGELYSARRQFELVTDNAASPAYSPLAGRAASRLVDVALQIQRLETLDDVLARVDRLSQTDKSESLRYARAKVLLGLGRFEDARAASEGFADGSIYGQRAAYLRGVALLRKAQDEAAAPGANDEATTEGATDANAAAASLEAKKPNYDQAIAAFESAAKVLSSSGEVAVSRRISDLSLLAIARLHFEQERYLRAAQAYEKIPRTSESFAEGLFELSWAYVRMGDYQRGQRTLEVLKVLDPGLIDGADAALLRADLLLRSGRFREADVAYQEVRNKYEPLRRQIDEFLRSHEDSAVYYDKLTAENIESSHELPALVVDWAREEAREDRVFAIVDDVARSRSLIKESRRRATLLRAALSGDTRAKVFPELRRQLEEVVALMNRLAIARLSLARGMDDEAGKVSGELATTRKQRQQLMARLGRVPTRPGDFTVRESEAEKQWNSVSQGLQRLELEADHLQALVNSLRRVLLEADRFGVQADAATIERYRAEIEENEKDMAVYRERIDTLRRQVEIGRVQSGFGDERFAEDERVRVAFREAFEKETSLTAGGADPRARDYAVKIQPLLAKIRASEAALEETKKVLDAESLARGQELEAAIEAEFQALETYAARLDTLDQNARVLVGEVARENFERVRARLKDVVLRSDVGSVQKAWEVRENQRLRVLDLLRERANEERIINDELREVIDDAEDTP